MPRVLLLLACCLMVVSVAAEIEMPTAFVDQGVTMLPLRLVAEWCDGALFYTPATATVSVTTPGHAFSLRVGESAITMNGQPVTLSHAIMSVDGATYVPTGVVTQALGAEVGWDAAAEQVTVTHPNTHEAFAFFPGPKARLARELLSAAEREDVGLVQRVLAASPAMDRARDAQGRTPLHVAAQHNAVATIILLQEAGAAPNAHDAQGNTPLHAAILAGHADAARLLLEHGADASAPGAGGKTPLALARAAGHAAIVALLQAHGAKE